MERRLLRLPAGLRQHVQRARTVAGRLAAIHGIDVAQADLGTAAHDLARALKEPSLLEEARRYGLDLHPVEVHTPLLLHGPVASLWLRHEDGVEDEEVLEAVRWHSTGRKGMGPVAKVVFLADKLDPEKVRRRPHLERIAALAEESLDRALLKFLNEELAGFLRWGDLIHPASVELRNELMLKLAQGGG